MRMAADYFIRQAKDADGLAAELDTPDKRRRYVAPFYGPRFWAAPGAFAREDVDFMTEPFGDADRFRASIANYEYAGGPRRSPEPPRLLEPNPTPTLILYGPEDHVIPRDFPQRMEAAFPSRAGPFVVQGAGHFLQWERADVLNGALRWLCCAPATAQRPTQRGWPPPSSVARRRATPRRRASAPRGSAVVISAASGCGAARPRRTRLPTVGQRRAPRPPGGSAPSRAAPRRPARSRSPTGRR